MHQFPDSDGAIPLMAHRGYAAAYPENTIEAIVAAADAGIRLIELDVQLSADHVPVVIHDATLVRTANRPEQVVDLTAAELLKIEVNETDRLGDAFSGIRIPLLADAAKALAAYPECLLFVEIKKESIEAFGNDVVVPAVLKALEQNSRCVIISFEYDCLLKVRELSGVPVGWVLREYSKATEQLATRLAPEYLLINHLRLKSKPWPGDWQWVCYEVTDVAHALDLADHGIDIISSMAAPELLMQFDLLFQGDAAPDEAAKEGGDD